ncbi:MAG: DEAD/DEAH box helicase [Thermoplasmata archaeon]|nr:DEAD/DEAH box helicase [Thermoplasmata archaeon]
MADTPETAPPKPRPSAGTFDELPLHPSLRRGIAEMGYLEPTPIQRDAIPAAVGGRDLIGTAQTGTGKTAAFLLPILERLMAAPRGRIHALVLTPTRELALQAVGFLEALGRHSELRSGAVYGGVGMAEQERALRGRAEIIVATPGRLLDHMSRGYVNFRELSILVLDEADRMLDMGFLPDVRRILRELPSRRQTLLFSATMPPEVLQLAREFLHDPKTVQVGETTAAAVGVSHLALPVPAHRKTDLLRALLEDETMTSVLVFARTKHRADRLARQLALAGLDVGVIHGNRSQNQRVQALERFRAGRHRLLVATDIAARGIDVEGISHVVNYDLPDVPEAYIHRVGRTARASLQGVALSFFSADEENDFHRIERHLGVKIPLSRVPGFDYERPAPALSGAAASRRGSGGDDRRRGGRTQYGGRAPYREQRGGGERFNRQRRDSRGRR